MSNSNNFSARTIDRLYNFWLRVKISALKINVSMKNGNDPIFLKK